MFLTILTVLGLISYLIYMKYRKSINVSAQKYDHVIIMGGSVSGMVTAAYLTKYFERITIVESDDVLNDSIMESTPEQLLDYRCRLESPTSLGRSGVSQIYQIHAFLTEGVKILSELFPKLIDKLSSEYNIRTYSMKNETRFASGGILLRRDLTEDFDCLSGDRFTLEIVMRKELCSQYGSQIEWKCNTRVTNLIVDQSSNSVKGITYRSKHSPSSVDIYGDFIIDCTGRNTSSLKWLRENFNLIVPTVQMHYGCGYMTFIGERFRTGDPSLDSAHLLGITTDSPKQNVGFIVMPIRTIKTDDTNSLGTLSAIAINCVNYEYPPNDSYENLLEWANENLGPEYYAILKATKVYSPLIPYRRGINDRKFVESLGKEWPQNYILLGDAMCTFNPQYAQGMTHACRQARALANIFRENSHHLKDISHIFNRRASVITDECWLGSIPNDWKSPTLKIVETDKYNQVKTYQRGGDMNSNNNIEPRAPLIIRFMQWYSYWFLRCIPKSAEISTDFARVIMQCSNPMLLMKPKNFFMVFYTALMNLFNSSDT